MGRKEVLPEKPEPSSMVPLAEKTRLTKWLERYSVSPKGRKKAEALHRRMSELTAEDLLTRYD